MDTEQRPLKTGLGPQTTAAEIVSGMDLRGKVIVVTGGHAGLGIETTRALSQAGAAVVVGARDLEKAPADGQGPLGPEREAHRRRMAGILIVDPRGGGRLVEAAGVERTRVRKDSARSYLAHLRARPAQGSMAYSMVTTTRATLSIVILS